MSNSAPLSPNVKCSTPPTEPVMWLVGRRDGKPVWHEGKERRFKLIKAKTAYDALREGTRIFKVHNSELSAMNMGLPGCAC